MDSGNNTELKDLVQQLKDVSLDEDKMELDAPKLHTSEISAASKEPEIINQVETNVEQPKLETETLEPEENAALIKNEDVKLDSEAKEELESPKQNAPEISVSAENAEVASKAVTKVEQPKIETEKEKYIQSKLNPKDEKEQKRLALKLQPGNMERKAGITAEQKRANFIQELEAEYEERNELASQSDFLIKEAVSQNVKAEKEKPWPWESEESQARADREISNNEARRKQYIEKNQDDILLKALKQEIRLELKDKPKDIQQLDNEEKAQAFVQPIANKRISETTQNLNKLSKDRGNARYYAKAPVQPKKNITNDFPDLEAAIGLHFRYPALQKELSKPIKSNMISPSEKQQRAKLIEQNQLKSDMASKVNKDVTDGRVLRGTAKKFKPVI